MNRIRLAKQIHQTAIDKGWWEEKRNHDEIFMLIITELSEAVEADREERWVSVGDFDKYQDSNKEKSDYIKFIKNTVEEEFADAYIRCLDYLFYRHREYINFPSLVFRPTDNFAENIFSICKSIGDRQIKDVVIMIEHLAIHLGIDLEWHVKQKMNFNTNRSYKHGGKKY